MVAGAQKRTPKESGARGDQAMSCFAGRGHLMNCQALQRAVWWAGAHGAGPTSHSGLRQYWGFVGREAFDTLAELCIPRDT